MAVTKRKDDRISAYLPLAYFAAALALVLAVLPTVLRPPQQPPTQSAELSPDAPPDDEQQSIISALNRASSGTTGAGAGVGETGAEVLAPVTVPGPPAFCPGGFGNPKRQTESIYSAPCAASWQGDNGGSTWKNVTGDEIRIGLRANAGNGTEGDVQDPLPAGASSADRTLLAMQRFFNANYQFYGRRLQLVQLPGADSVDDARANAIDADEVHHLFGAVYTASPGSAEFCKGMAIRKLITMCKQLDNVFYEQHAPYSYGFEMDTEQVDRFVAEYTCKKLDNRPAKFVEGDLVGRPRKFGLVFENSPDLADRNSAHLTEELRRQCGITGMPTVDMPSDVGSGVSSQAFTTISRFAAEGVTTVIVQTGGVNMLALQAAASTQNYFPEWVISSTYWNDKNHIGQLMAQEQHARAFGLSAFEMPTRFQETYCYRALRLIDPGNEPNSGACDVFWVALEQIANGIQLAGPNLTPTTFRDGLVKMGMRYYPEAPWSIGGGFRPGHWSYPDDVGEIWWDRNATAPQNGSAGAYRWVRNGQRFREGQLTTEDTLVFTDGQPGRDR